MVDRYVVFMLDDQRIALPLSSVDKAVRMVAITPLAKAPGIVYGIVNVQGRVVPVFDIRRRFRLPERELALADQLIVAHTAHRTVALAVDRVLGVIECPAQDLVAAECVLPDLEYVAGIAKLKDGLTLIHCLDTFLSLGEETALNAALATG
jgi:purine-binding chemotaxis protein CheW